VADWALSRKKGKKRSSLRKQSEEMCDRYDEDFKGGNAVRQEGKELIEAFTWTLQRFIYRQGAGREKRM